MAHSCLLCSIQTGNNFMLFRCRRSAFSLVEMIIATGVLVFGIYGIYNQFIETKIPSQQRQRMAVGRMLAHQKLEELLACSYDDLKSWKPEAAYKRAGDQPRYHFRAELKPAADQALEVTVDVAWDPADEAEQNFPSEKTVTVKGVRAP